MCALYNQMKSIIVVVGWIYLLLLGNLPFNIICKVKINNQQQQQRQQQQQHVIMVMVGVLLCSAAVVMTAWPMFVSVWICPIMNTRVRIGYSVVV